MRPWGLLALAVGCSSEPVTEIVVVIDTDADVPEQIDGLVIRVQGEQAGLLTDRPFVLGDGPDRTRLPADFGVVPREGREADEGIRIAVLAQKSSAPLFSTEVTTRFAERRMLRLDLLLARRCLDGPCPDEPCGPETCGALDVDPSSLPEFRP